MFVCLRDILLQTRYIPNECWNVGTLYCSEFRMQKAGRSSETLWDNVSRAHIHIHTEKKTKKIKQIKIESAISTRQQMSVCAYCRGNMGGWESAVMAVVSEWWECLADLKLTVDIHSNRKINNKFIALLLLLTPILYSSVHGKCQCGCGWVFVCNSIDKHWNLFGPLSAKNVCSTYFVCLLVHTQTEKKNTKVYKLPTQWTKHKNVRKIRYNIKRNTKNTIRRENS